MGKALHRGAEDLQKGGRASSDAEPHVTPVRQGAHPAFPLFYIHVVGRFAIDLTACWRPQRVGMLTVAVELSRALVEHASGDKFVLLCSRERPESLQDLDCEAVLSPYRHELVMKSRWLPAVEPQLEADAILYPYWPSPPFRRAGAPPAAVFVHDLAFRIRPHEVPWQQRMYFRAVLPPALRHAATVMVPSESTRRDLLQWYRIPGLEHSAAEPGARCLGHVDEPTLAALYASASVLAFPSLYEGFGLPLLEAMGHGVPAVVGATGALPELAVGSAISVNAEDTEAIAGGLERLLADEGLRKKLGEEGRRRAKGYSWANAAERTLEVLRRIGHTTERKAA